MARAKSKRRWRANNPDKARAQDRRWRERHRLHFNARARERLKVHGRSERTTAQRLVDAQRQRLQRVEHWTEVTAAQRARYWTNREDILHARRLSRMANREEINARQRERYWARKKAA